MKRKKYNIITFSLLAFFFLFGFLSKHLKEPVKPAAKTHHISHSLSSKSSSSHKKENTKSSRATSTEEHKTDAKDENKDQTSPSVQGANQKTNNQTTHQEGNQEKSKPTSLLKADEVGAGQKMALMPLTEEAVVVTMQPSPQVLVEEAITQAQLIRAMSGLTTLITILTNTHKLHQARIQLPIPINEITEYLSSPVFYFQP